MSGPKCRDALGSRFRREHVTGGWLIGHILHGEGRPLQILPQDSLLIRGKILLVHGRPHVGEPPIPGC